jgi:CRISPR-associated protein Cas2
MGWLKGQRRNPTFGGFRQMWIITLFDLPVDTKEAKRAYRIFHDLLIDDGFTMMQYSVYARHCPSPDNLEVHEQRVRGFLPDDGEVRIMTMTDSQFERMRIFRGKIRGIPEQAPLQLTIF